MNVSAEEPKSVDPSLIVVDDEALAETCGKIVTSNPWTAPFKDTRRYKGRRCVIVARSGGAHHLALMALAKKVADAGAASVSTVTPEPNRPVEWGLDKAIKDGWDSKRITDWIVANRQPYPPPQINGKKNLNQIWEEKRSKAEAERKANPNYKRWQEWGLQLGSGGVPLANLNNTVSILEQDEDLSGALYYDEFLQRVMTGDSRREWTDSDDINLALTIQRDIGLPRIGREIVAQAVVAVAHRNTKNCVRDWLDSLQHDGTARIGMFLTDCFGADDNEYTRAASSNFWKSMVARVYLPGCKVDNMLVIEGPQGAGKSTALQIIGGEWFAEQHESAVNPKGFAEILQGKLIIEISEMDAFNRVEVSRVKQTISCPSDRFRPSYGHRAKDHPRQCVFVGTTNKDDWNRDETGARRFWPVACRGSVNVAYLRENRDQLFAEAVACHKAGEPHWKMPDDATRAEQSARYQADPWLDDIASIVRGETRVTTSQIAEKLKIPLERRDRALEMRLGACLRFLGWGRKQRREIGSSLGRSYGYERESSS